MAPVTRSNGDDTNIHPLRHLGADITTLRQQLDEEPAFYEISRSLDAVQVLEFDGTTVSVKDAPPPTRPEPYRD